MTAGFFKVPSPINEPVKSYAPGSAERNELQQKLRELKSQVSDIPMYIGSDEIRTNEKMALRPPHEIKHLLGYYHKGDKSHVTQAINAALKAKHQWENLAWEHRASIFLKAADLIAGPYRSKLNAATMLGQSKNAHQAEIDSACEIIDFLRFNVYFMSEIYKEQPVSSEGIWNRLEYRPLEGFVFAITPFNFTAIAGNLPASAAMMGNTVVWKPADTQIYSANVLMEIFKAAGLPDGVINLIYVDGPEAGDVVFKHPDFAGLHFTGSTQVFKQLWKTIGNNIEYYKTYPRIVGETGGKDFILAHKSADYKAVGTAILRGGFEFQGQKCSAASRVYIPQGMWPKLKNFLIEEVSSFKMGSTEDFSNFVNAVIDERAFQKISGYIDYIKTQKDAEIVIGGGYDKSVGYFIEPTIVLTTNPKFRTMEEEIFGPIVTIYLYPDNGYEEVIRLIDETSPYALTGAVISADRYAIDLAANGLRHAAGNFYINDKPTGAVVGQQPFGGARGSGTNDKAGAAANLMRWVSMRTIKETFVEPKDYRYPFLGNQVI